ncbi:WD domain, G-beta repeat [Novymonas esmeraldas]|uniref:Cleavage stimulation factor 50 kDa subunit n=1 Tax=Novymonas esmeraldas TaxID=1808958 RepID=A0AAW0EVV5_9TRYP
MAGGSQPHRKRPRQGVLVDPLSREIYQMMVRQLHHDGFLAASSAVCDATGVMVGGVENDGDRLARVVAAGLSVDEMERRSAAEFHATQVVERFLSASKLYMPLSLSSRWSVGHRCLRMRERFVSASLGGVVRDISFSPDGAYVACAGANGLAAIFSMETVEDLSALDEVRAANRARALDGSRDAGSVGRGEAAPKGSATRNANEVTELAMVRRFHEHTQSVEVMRFHPTQPIVLSGGRDGDIYLRDYAYPDAKVVLKIHDTVPIRDAAFHPSGEYLVVAANHHLPRLINARTEKVLTPPGTYASSMAHAGPQWESGDSAAAAAGSYRPTDRSAQHSAALSSVCFSPDGRTMMSTSLDGMWMLYDGVSGRVIYRAENAHSGVPVTSVAYSRTGNVVLTAGMDSTARLWDLRRLHATSRNYQSPEVSSFGEPTKCEHRSIRAVFSANESHVHCHDSTLRAVHSYCVYSGIVVSTLTTQPSFMQRGLAASPWANTIVTGGDDSRLRLWTPAWLPS